MYLPQVKPILLWHIYIDGDRLENSLDFRFQTEWPLCTMQNISHCTDSGLDPYSLFLCRTGIRVQSIFDNVNEPLVSAGDQ